MEERLVDVLNARDVVLHVFPVATEDFGNGSQEAECLHEALKTAADLQLDPEMEGLHARMHVGRGGQLTPFGDVLEVRRQSQERAEQRIRTRAYFLWQRKSCPENQAEELWHQACEIEEHTPAS